MMTTSRTPFVLFLAAFVPPTLTPLATGQASGDATSSRVIRLPAEQALPIQGPPVRLDGRHLTWEGEGETGAALTLGPVFPTRSLDSVIERRVDQAGGRDAGISIESLGSLLLVRGGNAGEGGGLAQALNTAHGTIEEFHAITKSLRFRIRVRLLAGEGAGTIGPESGETHVVIDGSMVLATGERGAFGSRRRRPVVADFDVEVATSISIADPVNAVVETGETVHLWASTVQGPKGRRRLHIQGLLDIALEGPVRTFDPDVYELGELEQPTIHTIQVAFASTITPGEPLVVTLDGLRATRARRRLEITAEAVHPAGAGADLGHDASRVIDLGRGMWRTSIAFPHALGGEELHIIIPEARMPASAAQLITLIFGRDPKTRPELGSSIVLLPGVDAARNREVQALFDAIDPVGPGATLTVASSEDGFRATLPAARGALLRVARTDETLFVVDYDPQIANDAVLSDPRVELSMTGSLLECVLDWTEAGLRLRGSAHRITMESVAVRKSDPIDVGKIQQPVTTTESTRILLSPGRAVRGAGLDVTLTAR